MVVPLQMRVTLTESKKRKLITGMKQNSEEFLHYIQRKSCAKENVEYGGLFFKKKSLFPLNTSWTPSKTQQRMIDAAELCIMRSYCCTSIMIGTGIFMGLK